jgi:hypothetical protein
MTSLPTEGGSYLREKDGSLTRIDGLPEALLEPQASLDVTQTETSFDEIDDADSGKKGKA